MSEIVVRDTISGLKNKHTKDMYTRYKRTTCKNNKRPDNSSSDFAYKWYAKEAKFTNMKFAKFVPLLKEGDVNIKHNYRPTCVNLKNCTNTFIIIIKAFPI